MAIVVIIIVVFIVVTSTNQGVNYTAIEFFFKTIVSKKVNSLIYNFLRKKSPSWNRKTLFPLAIFLPSLFRSCYFGRFFILQYLMLFFLGADFCSCLLFSGLLYCSIFNRF